MGRDVCCKLKFFMTPFIIFAISLGILISIATAQVSFEPSPLWNYLPISIQSIHMPYFYTTSDIRNDILLNNHNYPFYGSSSSANRPNLGPNLGIPIYNQEVSLLNQIRYLNQHLYSNPSITSWTSPFIDRHIQIPVLESPIYTKGNILLNSFNLFYNYSYYNPITYGPLSPWIYLWNNPSDSHEQAPEPKPLNPIFNNLRLYRMGPLYAQQNEPYRYLFVSDYSIDHKEVHNRYGEGIECPTIFALMLNPDNFLKLQDPNDPNDLVVRYWIDLGADPNLFGQNDPNIAALFKRDQFIVDLSLPIFSDSNLRMSTDGPGPLAQCLIDQGSLEWNITIAAEDPNDAQDFLLKSLPVDVYDGMPTYLPAGYANLDALQELGKPYFQPGLVWLLEGALRNIGVTVWPNICALDYMPQPAEKPESGVYIPPYSIKNLNITIEVTNGLESDITAFPFIVLDKPIDNCAPVFDSDRVNLTFQKGVADEYVLKCIDPDCFIFSMSEESTTTHAPGIPISEDFRNDMDEIFCSIEKCIFPTSAIPNTLIDIENYVIKWSSEFEDGYCGGIYYFEVTCHDSRGGAASSEILILSKAKPGAWCGHPPIIWSEYPQQVKIGSNEEYVLYFDVLDPDGDEVYPICNIGTIEQTSEGPFVWKYRSSAYSASYPVEIFCYDIYGTYALIDFYLDVESL